MGSIKKLNSGEDHLLSGTITDLKEMVTDSLETYKENQGKYKEISNRVLDMVNKEEELSQWEAKDLLKILDLSNKAQLSPIEQLTKLVQAITNLHERSQLQDKIDKVSAVVDELKQSKESSQLDLDVDEDDDDDTEESYTDVSAG